MLKSRGSTERSIGSLSSQPARFVGISLILLAASSGIDSAMIDRLSSVVAAMSLVFVLLRSGLVPNRFFFAIMAFLSVASLGVVFSPMPGLGAVVLFAPAALLVAGAFNLKLDATVILMYIQRAAVVQSLLLCGSAIVQLVASGAVDRQKYGAEVVAPFSMAGAAASMTLLLCSSDLSSVMRRRHRVVLATSCLGVLLSQTRGQMLALALIIVLIVLVGRSSEVSRSISDRIVTLGQFLVVVFVVLLVVGVLSPQLSDRILGAELSDGLKGRTTEIEAVWDLIQASPIHGYGVGFRFDNPIAAGSDEILYVHNSLAYFALIAGAPLAILFAVVVSQLLVEILRRRDPPVLAVVAVGVALMLYSMTSAIQREASFVVLLAVALSISGSARNRNGPTRRVTPCHTRQEKLFQ